MFGTIFNLVNKFDHSVGEPGPIGKVLETVQGKVSVLNPLSANPTKWHCLSNFMGLALKGLKL